jgi:hypothetical protein
VILVERLGDLAKLLGRDNDGVRRRLIVSLAALVGALCLAEPASAAPTPVSDAGLVDNSNRGSRIGFTERSVHKRRRCAGRVKVKGTYATRIHVKRMSCRKGRRIIRAYHSGRGPSRERWYCAIVGPWPDAVDPRGSAWFCRNNQHDKVLVDWVTPY